MEQFFNEWAFLREWASVANTLLLFCVLFWFGSRLAHMERILYYAPYAKLVQDRRHKVVAQLQEPDTRGPTIAMGDR